MNSDEENEDQFEEDEEQTPNSSFSEKKSSNQISQENKSSIFSSKQNQDKENSEHILSNPIISKKTEKLHTNKLLFLEKMKNSVMQTFSKAFYNSVFNQIKLLKNRIPKYNQHYHKDSFNFLTLIGKGGYSKVWKVEDKQTKQKYAAKVAAKAKMISKGSVALVMNEKKFLKVLNQDFIVNMKFSFQEQQHLYL